MVGKNGISVDEQGGKLPIDRLRKKYLEMENNGS